MTDTDIRPELGAGVFSFPEAARLVRRHHSVSRARMRRWLNILETLGAHEADDGSRFLTFTDLVSLEVIASLRDAGLSNQTVRQAEQHLRTEFPGIKHPFAAVGIFYTDGHAVWAALDGVSNNVVEVVGRRRRHMVMSDMIRPFITEIHAGNDAPNATRWDIAPGIVVNPKIQFGRPVLAGTRVPVATVLENLKAGSRSEVADWFALTVDQVRDAEAFDRAT
jgi:uncharacterized protein (DUF433 family)